MENRDVTTLAGQIQEKKDALAARSALLDRYAQTHGRDRWYNRGCHDLTTLRGELQALEDQLAAGGTQVPERTQD
jgi:hypothetical protein